MDVIIEPEAEADLKETPPNHRRFIKERLNELEEQPTDHNNSDTIIVKGRQVFKYVMKQGNKGGIRKLASFLV